MALELAVGIVRVKVDRAQLRAEIAAARAAIIKGLSGIKVKVQVDTKGFERTAKTAGSRAGKAAGQAFRQAASAAATGMAVGGGGGLVARRGMVRGGGPFQTSPGTFLMPGRGRFGGGGAGGTRVFVPPPRGFLGGPGGGGGGAASGGAPPFFGGPFVGGGRFAGGGGGGRGGGGGGGGRRGGRFTPGGRGRFGGMLGMGPGAAFGTGFGFQVAPTLTASALFGGPAGAAGALTGMGAMAAGGAAADSVRTFADFEESIGWVKILQRESGATEQQLARLESQARELGQTTVFSAKDAADAMAVLTKRGFDANQVYQQMPGVMALAAAGEVEMAEAANTVGSVLQQFKMQASDAGQVADLLAKASIASATDVDQLGIALSYAGSTANLSEKDLKETVATLMLLSDAGISASRAGTGLTRILTGLSDPKKIAFLESMGIQATRDGRIRPMAELVTEVETAFKGMTALQRVQTAFQAFGQRGGPTFANLIDPDQFKRYLDMLNEAEGTATRLADKKMELLVNRFERLQDSVKELQITFAESFETEIKTSVDIVTESVNALSNSIKALKGNAQGAAGGGGQSRFITGLLTGLFPAFGGAMVAQGKGDQDILDALKGFNRNMGGGAAVANPPRGAADGAGAAPGVGGAMFPGAGLGMGFAMPGLADRIARGQGAAKGMASATDKFRPQFLGIEEFGRQLQTGVLSRKDDSLKNIEKHTKEGADAGKKAVVALENLKIGGRFA